MILACICYTALPLKNILLYFPFYVEPFHGAEPSIESKTRSGFCFPSFPEVSSIEMREVREKKKDPTLPAANRTRLHIRFRSHIHTQTHSHTHSLPRVLALLELTAEVGHVRSSASVKRGHQENKRERKKNGREAEKRGNMLVVWFPGDIFGLMYAKPLFSGSQLCSSRLLLPGLSV